VQSREVFTQLLGVGKPWFVSQVDLALKDREVRVTVDLDDSAILVCPTCGTACPGYDRRERRWRHLDTMQYETWVIAQVPRLKCPTHGIMQIRVPWAEDRSRFTAMFEALVIDWLQETSVSSVTRQLGLTWDQVAGIQARAVARGLARRKLSPPRFLGVDETSFQKRHEYVTSVIDLERGVVLHVADQRDQAALDAFYELLGPERCEQIEAVAMDMWKPYITSTQAHVPNADEKIVFDKFHIAKHLGDAVDKVRRQEHRELTSRGDHRLKRSKYLWLKNPENLTTDHKARFRELRQSGLKVARAWALKDLAMSLWGYMQRGWAERMWGRWYTWAIRCRLQPIQKVARMIRNHWEGVMNAATSNVTNAASEGMNSRIQWIKRKACGYRNRENFRNAIYFHCGGLDLYPNSIQFAHTNS
jgi:transposase